jgi:hypothetical protein
VKAKPDFGIYSSGGHFVQQIGVSSRKAQQGMVLIVLMK